VNNESYASQLATKLWASPHCQNRWSSEYLTLNSDALEIWSGLNSLRICSEFNFGVCCSSRKLNGQRRWSATPQTRQCGCQSWMLQCAMLALSLRVSGLKSALCAIHDTLQWKNWLRYSMQQDKCEITVSQENVLSWILQSIELSSVRLGLFLYWNGSFPKFKIYEW
jgi:hypothetical protein